MLPRKTTEEFIQQAKKVHGDKYDYSETVFINTRTKVKIWCKQCKQFFYQMPRSHLKGHGCAKCASKEMAIKNRASKEEFIEKAKKVHGNKYNYDLIEYIDSNTPVKIYCNYCKTYFYQTPGKHLITLGCPECSKRLTAKKISLKKASTIEEFIEKARKIHGNKYNYDKVNYINNYTKVEIWCNKCKEYFWQKPSLHLMGKDCPKCVKLSQKIKNKVQVLATRDKFIEKAKKIHGDKYDYSEVKYEGARNKVKIWCKRCQQYFYQTPGIHLKGCNCPTCVKRDKADTKEIFIEKATRVYGDKYDYSEVDFINYHTRVKIKCKKCNRYFYCNPASHLRGSGCSHCRKEEINKIQTKTKEQFIIDANKVHDFRYDYSKSKYINAQTKVEIICKKCGYSFWQTPANHLNKKGCPRCNTSKGEIATEKYLKDHEIKYETQKYFKECKYKKELPFDFYLPEHKICIEYQGQQHYTAVERWGGEKSLELQKLRDQIKRDYCKEHNIKLIEIKYNENIEKRLESELFGKIFQ